MICYRKNTSRRNKFNIGKRLSNYKRSWKPIRIASSPPQTRLKFWTRNIKNWKQWPIVMWPKNLLFAPNNEIWTRLVKNLIDSKKKKIIWPKNYKNWMHVLHLMFIYLPGVLCSSSSTMYDFYNFGLIFVGQCTVCLKGSFFEKFSNRKGPVE